MTDRQPRQPSGDGQSAHDDMRRTYLRFGAMIATSVVVMYLVTYLNVFDVAHIHFSQERVYMALAMGGAMGAVMMAWMWGMYRSHRWNVGIVVGSVLLVVVAAVLSQVQFLIGDGLYMRGMIPHHSIAILTSERADIRDLRVRKLADGIIEAQRREIAEMEWLLDDIAKNGEATTAAEADARPVPSFAANP